MSEMTVIQVVRGDDNSGTRRHLNDAQRAGQACVVCHGTENLTRHVGWVDGVSIRVHSYHLENYRLGERSRRRPPEQVVGVDLVPAMFP